MLELSTKTVPQPDGGQARYIDAYAQGLVTAESKLGEVKDYTAYFKVRQGCFALGFRYVAKFGYRTARFEQSQQGGAFT